MYWLSVFLGYNVGYGSAGLGLGHRYGNGWMKGPKPGRTITTCFSAFQLYVFIYTLNINELMLQC